MDLDIADGVVLSNTVEILVILILLVVNEKHVVVYSEDKLTIV